MTNNLKNLWVWGLLVVAPLQLGAKGCDAVVGNDPNEACGGLQGLTCASGAFCDFAPDAMCGAADATGVCRTIPEQCTLEYSPMCGCDGVTYGNTCAAHMAGVSVESSGECGGGSNACGGLQGLTCATGEFCDYARGDLCGAADATGTCRPLPQACDAIYDPVCGCDGDTYGNACEANLAGVSVASDGECGGGEPVVCGGFSGTICPSSHFCNYPPEMACGLTDGTGTCTLKPEVCADIYAPVCGCDGRTYENACTANGAGVSVAAEGSCEPEPDPGFCGGIAGFGCPSGEFCNYPIETQCGAGDMAGACMPIPDACTQEYAPVCGCDGMTYSNACTAHGAGVSVLSAGECP